MKKNGITLIALIITIIILIILAAISIKVIVKEDIIETAINGTEKYTQAGYKEAHELQSTIDGVTDRLDWKDTLIFEDMGTIEGIDEKSLSISVKATSKNKGKLKYTLYWSKNQDLSEARD